MDTVVIDSLEENYADIESVDDKVGNITSSEVEFIKVKDKFDWLNYSKSDWESFGDQFRLIIRKEIHNCLNAYVDSMLIKVGDEFENNLPTWKITSADSIIILAFEPVECKVLIKGDR